MFQIASDILAGAKNKFKSLVGSKAPATEKLSLVKEENTNYHNNPGEGVKTSKPLKARYSISNIKEQESNALQAIQNNLNLFKRQTTRALLDGNEEIIHFKDRRSEFDEGHSKFILSSLAELLNFSESNLWIDNLFSTINILDKVQDIIKYDSSTNTISIRDPHDQEKEVKVPLDSRIVNLRSIDSIYVKYYLLAIRELTRYIKNKAHIVNDDPKSLKSLESFTKFRDNLKNTLRLIGLGDKEIGVSNYRKALEAIKFSKKNEMVKSISEILQDKDFSTEQVLDGIASKIEAINSSKDKTYLFGDGERPNDNYLSVLKAIRSNRLEGLGLLEPLLDKPEAFFDSYVNYVVYILHKIMDEEKIQKALFERGDITRAEFEKVISCALAQSSLEAYKQFMVELESVTEASSAYGQYARQLVHYKSKILPLILISIFGLHTSPDVSIGVQKWFKDIFSYTRKKSGKLSFNYEVVSSNDFNNFINHLISEYKYRFGALFVKKAEGLKEGSLDYQNLSAFREDWLHYMLSVLVDLISNPQGSSDPNRNDKVKALVRFFTDISDYETNIIKQFNSLLNDKQRLSDLRLSEEDIARINKFRLDLAGKDLKAILGFNPKDVFKDKELRQIKILEVELFAIIQALTESKTESPYELKWKSDLYKNRSQLYKLSPGGHNKASLKRLFDIKLKAIQSLSSNSFNLKEFLNVMNKGKFLRSFTNNLLKGASNGLLAEDLRCLISLARLPKNWKEIFGKKETSESAYELFQGSLDNLLAELSSKSRTTPDKIHEILSDPKRYMYLLEYIEKTLIHGSELDIAPELGAALYFQALKALDKSSNPVNAESLFDMNSYERRLIDIFMDPKIRSGIAKISPDLYKSILSTHSHLLSSYMQNAQSLINFLSERIKLKVQSGNISDLSKIEDTFNRLVLDVYYPIELAISNMPKNSKGRYKFVSIENLIDKIGEFNSALFTKLIEIADRKIANSSSEATNEKELNDKKLFAKAILDKAHGLAVKIERISTHQSSTRSFQSFLENLVLVLSSGPVNLIKSSHQLSANVVQAIFQKLYLDPALSDSQKFYLRLAYSYVRKNKSLGALNDLLLPRERAEAIFGLDKESSGHIFIGDDMFRSPVGRERVDAIEKFCDVLPVLYSLNLDEKNDLLENSTLNTKISKIEEVVKLRPVFYKVDSTETMRGESIPNDQLKILRDNLSKSFMQIKKLNPYLKNSDFKWISYAPRFSYKDEASNADVYGLFNSGHMQMVNIGSALPEVKSAIESLSLTRMPRSQIRARANNTLRIAA